MPWILLDEGQVFRSDPHEGGGAVKMGITFEAFTAWRC
jgi:lysozyme family protein